MLYEIYGRKPNKILLYLLLITTVLIACFDSRVIKYKSTQYFVLFLTHAQ